MKKRLPLGASLYVAIALLGASIYAVAGDYYDHGSFPATNSSATSASMRAELDLIAAGFAKFPSFSGNNNKPLILNSGATGYTFTTGTLALAGNFATAGAYATTFTMTGATGVTFPTTGTLSTLAGSESLSNKTLPSPVLSGSVTGAYTLAGTPTLTSPTITSPTITGTTSIGNGATITTPVLSGSVTGTYTLAGTPTITAPVLSGSATGTYTLAGTPTITAPTITSPTVSTGPLTMTSGQIAFPATQAASADANTLDDYEEGTWTPTINFGGASVGITYTTQQGNYVKIGRFVHCTFQIVLSSKGSSTGDAFIGGQPFPFNTLALGGPFLIYWANAGASFYYMQAIRNTDTQMRLLGVKTAGATPANMTDTDFANNTFIYGQMSYLTTN